MIVSTKFKCTIFSLSLALATSFVSDAPLAQEAKTEKTTFDDHIKAVFAQRCASCHNPNKRSADLDVTNFTNLMQGGASGSVIEPGDPDFSRLFDLVTHSDEPKMPPSNKIPDAEIELIQKWIEGGALENMGSTAMVKKKVGVAMAKNPLIRPEVVAVPPRLSLQPSVHTSNEGVVASIATSPWAPLAAVAGQQQVFLYNTQTLQLNGVLPFPEGTVNVVKFSRNGQLLMAAGGKPGASGKVVLWDVASGERLSVIGDEFDSILAADISADHSQVAIGGSARTVKVYSTLDGKLLFEMTKHTEWVTSIEFSPDGVLLATGDRNGGLFVWEAMTGREYLTLKGHTATITTVSWRGDSNVLASGSKDTTIRTWEMNNGSQIKSWNGHGGGTQSIEFTRDGRILSAGRDRVTKLWDQAGKQLKAFPATPDMALSVSWCDETARAIAGDYSGALRVWQESDAAQLAAWTSNPPTLEMRLSSAQSVLQQKSAELKPQQESLNAVSTQVTQVETALAEAKKIQAAAAEAVNGLNTKIKSANVAKTETDKLREQLNGKLARANEAKPLISEALRNLTEAAAKLTDNQVIGQQAEALAAELKQIDTNIAALNEQLAGIQSKISETDTQLAAASDKMQQAQKELNAANENVAAGEAKLKPLVEQKQKVAATVSEIAAAVEAAKAETARWQGEIDFVNLMKQLQEQLESAQSVVQQRATGLDEANAQLTSAQAAVDAATQSKNEAENQVNGILEKMHQAKQIDK